MPSPENSGCSALVRTAKHTVDITLIHRLRIERFPVNTDELSVGIMKPRAVFIQAMLKTANNNFSMNVE